MSTERKRNGSKEPQFPHQLTAERRNEAFCSNQLIWIAHRAPTNETMWKSVSKNEYTLCHWFDGLGNFPWNHMTESAVSSTCVPCAVPMEEPRYLFPCPFQLDSLCGSCAHAAAHTLSTHTHTNTNTRHVGWLRLQVTATSCAESFSRIAGEKHRASSTTPTNTHHIYKWTWANRCDSQSVVWRYSVRLAFFVAHCVPCSIVWFAHSQIIYTRLKLKSSIFRLFVSG